MVSFMTFNEDIDPFSIINEGGNHFSMHEYKINLVMKRKLRVVSSIHISIILSPEQSLRRR